MNFSKELRPFFAWVYIRFNEGKNKVGALVQVLTFAGVFAEPTAQALSIGYLESLFALCLLVLGGFILFGSAYISFGFFGSERMRIADVDPLLNRVLSEKEKHLIGYLSLPQGERIEALLKARERGTL